MNNKYQKILTRKSIRKFRADGIKPNEIRDLEGYISRISSYRLNIHLDYEIREFINKSQIQKAVGIYGKIMSPAYVLIPFLESEDGDLSDLGFLTQHITLKLWEEDIGSCYIGCVHRQNQAKAILGLKDTSRIAAFLFFGKANEDQSPRFYQKISRFFTGSKNRKPLEDLLIDPDSMELIKANSDLEKILNAGRFAPSAVNAQPWRFQIDHEEIRIFSTKRKKGRVFDPDQNYARHDTGICMANMAAAAKTTGKPIRWEPLNAKEMAVGAFDHGSFEPVAKCSIKELRKINDKY
jgi:nitroreductase